MNTGRAVEFHSVSNIPNNLSHKPLIDAMHMTMCYSLFKVTEVLQSYGQLLQAVAYLLPDDVHRLVEEEAHSINLSILANRRGYAKLCMHLMNSECLSTCHMSVM